MDKYRTRLYQEWKQHGKIVIAVDFDDTLYPWGFKTKEDKRDLDETIELLRIAHETGAYIAIFTCSNIDRYPEIQSYCESIKLPIDAINVNPIDLPYGKHGKIYANIYLDDRGGLKESLAILKEVMYKIRGENASKLTMGEEGPYTT